MGLSPRLRGNRTYVAPVPVHIGSIPAPAGEPSRLRRTSSWPPVYPRACGGTAAFPVGSALDGGLSPRLRGNRPPEGGCKRPRRSIPAPAGEPPGLGEAGKPAGVYPRACGGTQTRNGTRCLRIGLSPRLRGNRSPARCRRVCRRSIPAPAGEPSPKLAAS